MDLRPFLKNQKDIDQGIKLISKGDLFYQPFILADDLEVGEGQNFVDFYKNVDSVLDLNVYSERVPFAKRKLAANLEYFRQCNAEYRQQYAYITEQILKHVRRDVRELEFGEIGCNSGLNLFNLAKAGAKSCHGYDWNDMSGVFNWLNQVLGTNVRFQQGIWENLSHQFTRPVPVVDVMINTVFTNHQCDPLQFLSYICDRSREGVFLWMLIAPGEGCFVRYPERVPHQLISTKRRFPLNYDNDVSISEGMLRNSLNQLGFAEVAELSPPTPNNYWKDFNSAFRMFYARRTEDVKSAYWKSDRSIARRIAGKVYRTISKKH